MTRKGIKEETRKAPLSDMKSFSVHDLRRSAATAWSEYLKVKPHVIKNMLNHQLLNKLVTIYQRANYACVPEWIRTTDLPLRRGLRYPSAPPGPG